MSRSKGPFAIDLNDETGNSEQMTRAQMANMVIRLPSGNWPEIHSAAFLVSRDSSFLLLIGRRPTGGHFYQQG